MEAFFESLACGGSVHGWRFFDEPGMVADWPNDPSLRITLEGGVAAHSLYWFNECGAARDGETESFCIEGIVTFDVLIVLDAADREIPIDTYIADGVRKWDALCAHDDRLSVEAQGASQQGALKRRQWAVGSESANVPDVSGTSIACGGVRRLQRNSPQGHRRP